MKDISMSGVEVFKEFLKNVYIANLPLILLRPREICEDMSYSGNYDFFIDPSYNDKLLKIMFDLAVKNSISFSIIRVKYSKVDIAIYDKDEDKKISLEIWNILSVKDPKKKTLRYITPERLKSFIFKQDDGSFSLALDIEALYYLSYLATGGKKLQTPLVQERIADYSTKLKTKKYIEYFDSLKDNKDIKIVAHIANMELVEKGLLFLKTDKKELFKESLLKGASISKRIQRKLFKLFNMVAIMGPDGVGKTTLIKKSVDSFKGRTKLFQFKKTFRNSPLYKLTMPFLKQKIANRFKTMNIGKSEVDDIYGGFVILNAFVMYQLRLIRSFITKETTFIDRYFYEYLMEDTRFFDKKAKLRKNWKMLSCFIPRPHVVIQLDAPQDVILKRKNELDEDGIIAFRNLIFQTLSYKPPLKYLYINTTMPLDRCRDVLLDVME